MSTVHSTENDGTPPPRKPLNRPKGNTLLLDFGTPEGRYAARAYAFFVMSGDFGLFQQIMERVGREG